MIAEASSLLAESVSLAIVVTASEETAEVGIISAWLLGAGVGVACACTNGGGGG